MRRQRDGKLSRRRYAAGSIALAGGLLLAALGSAGVAGASAAPHKQSPVLIGVSLSLSGDNAAYGQAFKQGYELWADYQNAHGGLLGHPIQLKILSDASSLTQLVTNYETLITLDHVQLILGPFSTLFTVPTEKVAHRFGYALIDGAGGGPEAFAAHYRDYFDVSVPVIGQLLPFAKWLATMPKKQRPTTVAYATSNDPFTQPMIPPAQKVMQKAGIRTVYYKVFPAEVTDYTPIADAVAASHAQVVVLGSVDASTVAAFMQAFEQTHYNPKAFIATSGPDSGSSFVSAVGASNTGGIMVPDQWFPSTDNALNHAMTKLYLKKFGGTLNGMNGEIGGTFSSGEVLAAAVKGSHSISNAKIISWLHGNHTIQTVQGPVKFNSVGQTFGGTYIFQWQHLKFVQILPKGAPGSVKTILYPKPVWGQGG